MQTTDLLDRAKAVPVTGRAAVDERAIRAKNLLIEQAREAHAAEVAALRAEIAALRSGRAA